MAEILVINGAEVKIGEANGKVTTVPLASLHFSNPQVGDKVEVFRDGDTFIVKHLESCDGAEVEDEDGVRVINKHIFVWIGTFLFGGFGVDRFMRGQTGLGVLKLLLTLLGWIPLGMGTLAVGIWCLVDWVVALTKAYGSAYGSTEMITFDEDGNYTR